MKFVILLVLCCGSVFGLISVQPIVVSSLEALYNATTGPLWAWQNTSIYGPEWTFAVESQQDPCADTSLGVSPIAWQGVTCSLPPEACESSGSCDVITVNLARYNLSGSLPTEFFQNTALENIILDSNSLTGPLPDAIYDMPRLSVLSLEFNYLTGRLSTRIGRLNTLEELLLSCNWMDGILPTELGAMSSLRVMHLGSDGFTGTIPAEIMRLTQLVELLLGPSHGVEYTDYELNLLENQIPSSIGHRCCVFSVCGETA